MNPVPWGDALQRLQRNVEPRVPGVSDSMREPSTNNNGCDTYNMRDADELLNSVGVNMGWEELSSLCLKLKSQQSDVEEPDGAPLRIEEPTFDSELARKQEELRQIQQNILFKKAAIALKSVKSGFSCDEQSERCKGESLRDRVTLILQQRRSLGTLPEMWPPRKRMKSSRNGLLLDDHPLKQRVRALMKQRCSNLSVPPPNREVLDAAPPAPAQEETRDVGFQRFLSVLNKGVDISYLSRIVNDDSESQQLHSGEEKKTNVQEDEPRSRSRSNSPPSVKTKGLREEEKPKESQSEQLQSILQTLGMSLAKEEMSKLADRTQERLFGKRPEGREEEKSQPDRTSVSPSGSSCASHPSSPGSSHQNPPHTRDSESGRSGSGEGPWVSEEAQMPRDADGEGTNSIETSFNQYEFSQEPASIHPYPAAYSQYSNYTVLQHSPYPAYHSAAINAYSTYTQGVTPAPLHPSGYPDPPFSDPYFPAPAAARCTRPMRRSGFQGVNPDLSESEGQLGSGGRRCLKVVSTGFIQARQKRRAKRKMLRRLGGRQGSFQPVPTYMKEGPKQKKKKKPNTKQSPQQRTLTRILENMQEEEASWPSTEVEKRNPMADEKREKVKAYLAKKIESLNQRKKQLDTQPANSQTSH